MQDTTITLEQLQLAATANHKQGDFLLVEGAGGFYSPIAEDGLNADLAKKLQLDVIIVVEDRLGGINQALLTLKAVQNEGLDIQAVVLNRNNDNDQSPTDNLSDLSKLTQIPVYSCSYQGKLPKIQITLAST